MATAPGDPATALVVWAVMTYRNALRSTRPTDGSTVTVLSNGLASPVIAATGETVPDAALPTRDKEMAMVVPVDWPVARNVLIRAPSGRVRLITPLGAEPVVAWASPVDEATQLTPPAAVKAGGSVSRTVGTGREASWISL